jgi:predicted ABC-type ATPase
MAKPKCIVIAGPNGAGKTTFARRYLPEHGVTHFINADLIATGLSPFSPEAAALAAGKLFLRELDRLEKARESFAFETTLSGLVHLTRLKRLKEAGYHTQIAFLKLDTPDLAVRRVASRVRQGGHHVPAKDVERRFHRGWNNFVQIYSLAVSQWVVYDNTGDEPVPIDASL